MNTTFTVTCQLLKRGRVRITLEVLTLTGARKTKLLSSHNEERSAGPSYSSKDDTKQQNPAFACLPLRRVRAAALNADSIASDGMHG
jgi:hypothetical protein